MKPLLYFIVLMCASTSFAYAESTEVVPEKTATQIVTEYCHEQGGEFIKNDDEVYGICHFEDGRTIEEWQIYQAPQVVDESLAGAIITIITSIITALLVALGKYKVFQKAGVRPWGAFVPVYNKYLLFKIIDRPRWTWSIFFPPIYVFLSILSVFHLAKKFRKNDIFAMGLAAFPMIFYPILGFSKKAQFHAHAKHTWKLYTRIFMVIIAGIIAILGLFGLSAIKPGLMPAVDSVREDVIKKLKKVTDFVYHPIMGFINETEFYYQDENMISWKELEPHLADLQPGDVMFTSSIGYVSNLAIPGDWKHAFLYIGNGEIIDASSKGVQKRSIKKLSNLERGSLLGGIVAFRPNISEEQMQVFLSFVESQIGKPYDFGFKGTTDESYYCSNLVSDGLELVGITVDQRIQLFGIDAVAPINMVNYFYDTGIERGEVTEVLHISKIR